MAMNYDIYSLGNRGNGLPLYGNYLKFTTKNSLDKNWFKMCDFNLQRNSEKVTDIYNRRLNRIFLTGIVYDGDADVMQAMGLLTLSVWVPLSDTVKQEVHTEVNLRDLLDDNNESIKAQLEVRVYSKKVVNDETDEYNIQIWCQARQWWSKVALHPLQADFVRPPYNPHSLLDNYFSNEYERLTELFKPMGSESGITDTDLDNAMKGYDYVTTNAGEYIETFYTTSDQCNIADGVEYINIASKDGGPNAVANIIPNKRNSDGRIIRLVNWNNVVLKNGGKIQDTANLQNAIICPDGQDYAMKQSEMVQLIRFANNWFVM